MSTNEDERRCGKVGIENGEFFYEKLLDLKEVVNNTDPGSSIKK